MMEKCQLGQNWVNECMNDLVLFLWLAKVERVVYMYLRYRYTLGTRYRKFSVQFVFRVEYLHLYLHPIMDLS